MSNEICLAIECTAHTLGIGMVKDTKKGIEILSNEKDMYVSEKGGMIPNELREHHRKVRDSVYEGSLKAAGIKEKDISLIAFSQGPGMAPALLAGLEFAKSLSVKLNKPLIGVNHFAAHLEIGRQITKTKDPIYVFVSGANTQIIAHEGGRFRVFGETMDIGMGNALDKFGRLAGLGFPAGPKIEELAKNGKYIELPYVVKGMDVGFSGIATKAEQLLKKGAKVEDLCFSLQETCFAMVAEVTERALAHCGKEEVILIGGVAANKRFCEMLDIMCKSRGCRFFPVPLQYCGDNGAMIAMLGLMQYRYSINTLNAKNADINPNWRIDDMEVPWIKG